MSESGQTRKRLRLSIRCSFSPKTDLLRVQHRTVLVGQLVACGALDETAHKHVLRRGVHDAGRTSTTSFTIRANVHLFGMLWSILFQLKAAA